MSEVNLPKWLRSPCKDVPQEIWGNLKERAADEINRLQEQERTSSTALLKQIEVNAGLREALDKIRVELADPCGQETLDRIDEIARAALEVKP
jgi:hypothetical protein